MDPFELSAGMCSSLWLEEEPIAFQPLLDHIETDCMAWAIMQDKEIHMHSKTIELQGSRRQLQKEAAEWALKGLMTFYKKVKA